ncbi:hypothetical protein, partial [Streptomyces clavuligerus]|uniref:hypothetical protein n=1 Tax=Streptomyces clavuligerus TaxID=1901 RepID=UPI001E4999DB
MNAPYDGDRGQGPGMDPAGQVPPQPAPDPSPQDDLYAQGYDPYAQGPYQQGVQHPGPDRGHRRTARSLLPHLIVPGRPATTSLNGPL